MHRRRTAWRGGTAGEAVDDAFGTDVPPVVVEQEQEVEPAAPVVAVEPEPTPRPGSLSLSPAAPPASRKPGVPDARLRFQEAVEQAIFDLPVDGGGTLNRGASGVDGYYAAGTSSATKTNTLNMNIPGSVSIIRRSWRRTRAPTRWDRPCSTSPASPFSKARTTGTS